MGRVDDPAERSDLAFRAYDYQLEITGRLSYVQVAGPPIHGDVVDSGERLPPPKAIPYQFMTSGHQVDRMDPVVKLGGEEHPTLVVPAALPGRGGEGVGYLLASRVDRLRRVSDLPPGHRAVPGHRHGLEGSRGQVGPCLGDVPVEATEPVVLGQVDGLADRVNGRPTVVP